MTSLNNRRSWLNELHQILFCMAHSAAQHQHGLYTAYTQYTYTQPAHNVSTSCIQSVHNTQACTQRTHSLYTCTHPVLLIGRSQPADDETCRLKPVIEHTACTYLSRLGHQQTPAAHTYRHLHTYLYLRWAVEAQGDYCAVKAAPHGVWQKLFSWSIRFL